MARFSTAQKETLRKMAEEGKLATSQLQNIMRNAEELRQLNKGGVVGFQAGGVPNPQEEQMKMFNQANQNAMQMGTGNPQSATYQASLGPAATNQQPTQFATQVTPEQMAAQQQAQTQANVAQQQAQTATQAQIDAKKAAEQGIDTRLSPEQRATRQGYQDALQKKADAYIAQYGEPQDQAAGDAMNKYMQGLPEYQQMQQYQQGIAEQFKKTGEVRGGPALPVEPPEGIDDGIPPIQQPIKQPKPPSSKKLPQLIQTPKGSFNAQARVVTLVDGTTRQEFTIKDSKGKTVATLTGAEEFRNWMEQNEGTSYDPSQGMPEALPEPDFSTGYLLPDYAEGQLKTIAMGDTNLGSATIEGNTVKFADGKTIKANTPEQAQMIVDAANKYKTEVQDPHKAKEEAYRKYISEETAGGVTGDIENIEEEYKKAQSNYKQEELELQRLKAQAEANPNDPYLKGLVEEKEKTVTDLFARIKQLEPTFKESQKTISDIMIEKAKDPASLVTKTKVDTIDPETAGTIIPEDTGQLKGDISYDPVKGVVTTSEGVEKADAATYDATTVSGKAKEELDKVEAATLDEFSKGVTFEGEQGELSEGAYADEALKVAADRIQKVNEKVDLEVTKQQLAEAKGKNLKAIQTKVAKSSALLDAIAAAHVVQPNELPTPQLIAEEDMAQAKAMTDTGLDKDAIPIAAKMASFSVDNGTLAKAAQGDVDSLATVEGQLGKLMKQFDDGTPAWAAGAIRAANAAMSSRGLGASSMAGAAILQAAMESALPIAQQDATTFAQMGMQNLNNRQQVAVANAAAQQGLQLQNLDNEQKANLQKSVNAFGLQTQNLSNRQAAEVANAQIRATLQGQNLSNRQQTNIAEAARYAEAANINLNNKQQAAMQDNSNALQTNLAELSSEQSAYINSANAAAALQGQVLSNDQQVSIANAARYSEAANIEFTAEQQNALHNSKLMSSIGLAELNTTQAATLQNAATVANMDITNLNNRQQAAVQNAKSFLQRDMTNLSNEQQTVIFKAQATQQALLSDQAADNAAKQFNASSENQTNQFFANLEQQNNQFNAAQANAMEQANVNAENAALEFNANIKNNREQFNASSALVIAQANAQWKQNVATINTAAQNEANTADAAAANAFTSTTMDEVWQRERDLMDFAFTASESEQDRINNVVLQKISADATLDAAKLKADMEADSTIGSWVRDIIFT